MLNDTLGLMASTHTDDRSREWRSCDKAKKKRGEVEMGGERGQVKSDDGDL
jgi:hypothetical protein